ncbi:choline/ethanolamine kinase [Anopheles sinensis]|uniref:Choline/ethanolamine kinase n=1 Tax=Anopheles sinensis TaxID=74873 RepID=A0A084WNW7_ANOSI|nr:choline/ethanolamine kinase [Anopheles sinensis]
MSLARKSDYFFLGRLLMKASSGNHVQFQLLGGTSSCRIYGAGDGNRLLCVPIIIYGCGATSVTQWNTSPRGGQASRLRCGKPPGDRTPQWLCTSGPSSGGVE